MSRGNEPAYPRSEGKHSPAQQGVTLREHYAGLAMQGLLSGGEFLDAQPRQAESVAAYAVQQADALLAELAKAQP